MATKAVELDIADHAYSDSAAREMLDAIRRPGLPVGSEQSLANVCLKHGIRLLVLFGSQAKGRAREDSDVDIAFLSEGRRRVNPLDLYMALVPILGNSKLDIVDLRSAPPLLRWYVALEGVALWSADSQTWLDFKVRACSEWNDNRRYQKYWSMAVKRFLAEHAAK